jgi:hypothetical protein
MKYTVKTLNPVYRAYIATIIDTIRQIPGVVSVSLDSENQYNFVFTFESGEGAGTTK